MSKRIIAVLVTVIMCTELLAGCAASTVTSTVIGTEANEPSEDTDKEIESSVIQTGKNGMVMGNVVNYWSNTPVPNATLTLYDDEKRRVEIIPYTRDVSGIIGMDGSYTKFGDDIYDVLYPLGGGKTAAACHTDGNGFYAFKIQDPGTYYLQVEAEGFYKTEYQTIEYYDKYHMTVEDFKESFQKGVEKGLENAATLEEMEVYLTELEGYLPELKEIVKTDGESLLAQLGASEQGTPGQAAEFPEIQKKVEELIEKLEEMLDRDAFWSKVELDADLDTIAQWHSEAGRWSPYAPVTWNPEVAKDFFKGWSSNIIHYPTYWNEKGGKEMTVATVNKIAQFAAEEAVENAVIAAAVPVVGVVGAGAKTGVKLSVKIICKGVKLGKAAGLADDAVKQAVKSIEDIQGLLGKIGQGTEASRQAARKEAAEAARERADDFRAKAGKAETEKARRYYEGNAKQLEKTANYLENGDDVTIGISDSDVVLHTDTSEFLLASGEKLNVTVKVPSIEALQNAGLTDKRAINNYSAAVSTLQQAAAKNDIDTILKLLTKWIPTVKMLHKNNYSEELKALYDSFLNTLKSVKSAIQPTVRSLRVNASVEVQALEEFTPEMVKQASRQAVRTQACGEIERACMKLEEGLRLFGQGEKSEAARILSQGTDTAHKRYNHILKEEANVGELEECKQIKEVLTLLRNNMQTLEMAIRDQRSLNAVSVAIQATTRAANKARSLIYDYGGNLADTKLPIGYTEFCITLNKAMDILEPLSRGKNIVSAKEQLAALRVSGELGEEAMKKGEELLEAVQKRHDELLLQELHDKNLDAIEEARSYLGSDNYDPLKSGEKKLSSTRSIRLETRIEGEGKEIYDMSMSTWGTMDSIVSPQLKSEPDVFFNHDTSIAVKALKTVTTNLQTAINTAPKVKSRTQIAKMTPEEALEEARRLDENFKIDNLMQQAGQVKANVRAALHAGALKETDTTVMTARRILKDTYQTVLDSKQSLIECLQVVSKGRVDMCTAKASTLLEAFQSASKGYVLRDLGPAILLGGMGAAAILNFMGDYVLNRSKIIEADIPDFADVHKLAGILLYYHRQRLAAEKEYRYAKHTISIKPVVKLYGRVVDILEQTPLNGAEVMIEVMTQEGEVLSVYEEKSAGSGSFYLEPGEEVCLADALKVSVRKEGYVTEVRHIADIWVKDMGEIVRNETISYVTRKPAGKPLWSSNLGRIGLRKAQFTVSGRVVDEKGVPIQNAEVTLREWPFMGYEDITETKENGSFGFSVKTCSYSLSVTAAGYEPRDGRNSIFTIEKDIGDIVIVLKNLYRSPAPLELTPSPKTTTTPQATPSPAATVTPEITPSPAVTVPPTITPSPAATVTPKTTPSPRITATPKPTPSVKPTPTVKPTPSPTPVMIPSETPVPAVSPTSQATAVPTVMPTD